MSAVTSQQALAVATRRIGLSPRSSDVAEVATALLGLHATNPVSPYMSLLARIPGFVRADLDQQMWNDWRMVRFRAMRLTMFIFPHDLLKIATAATRHLSETYAARWLRDSDFTLAEFDRIAATVDTALAERPMTVRELRQELSAPRQLDLSGVVARMCDTGRLVAGAPPGDWRSSIRRYHRWEDVVPDVDLHRWNPQLAAQKLIHRYIRSYGPVTLADIAWWTGLTKTLCRRSLDAMGGTFDSVTVADWPGPLMWIPGRRPATDLDDTVFALPVLDPYVQGYRDRQRFLDPERNSLVYDRGGNATATLVHRGRIIGVWQFSTNPGDSVRYHLFDPVPAHIRRAAETALANAGSLFFEHAADVVDIKTMLPLSEGGGRSALHPLDTQVHRASHKGLTAAAKPPLD